MEPRRRDVLKLAALVLASCARPLAVSSAPLTAERSTAMHTRPLMTLRLVTALTRDVGSGPHGQRVIFPITGGSFEGDRLRGNVLPGGEDWTVRRADGVLELDLRATLQTDDGELVYVTFEGIRADPYFRTLSRFETASSKYAFLNRLLAVGVGEIRADGPVHVIEELL